MERSYKRILQQLVKGSHNQVMASMTWCLVRYLVLVSHAQRHAVDIAEGIGYFQP